MHTFYPLGAEEELVATLSQGLVAAPISTTSSSKKEPNKFLQTLHIMRNNLTTIRHHGCRFFTVARLWLMTASRYPIARTRNANAYGPKFPNLDEHKDLNSLEVEEISLILKVLSNTMLLGTPNAILEKLPSTWHGRITYHRHWETFWRGIRRDWIHRVALTLGMWV